jgi:hypothetical protein
MDFLLYVIRVGREICLGCIANKCADKHIAGRVQALELATGKPT